MEGLDQHTIKAILVDKVVGAAEQGAQNDFPEVQLPPFGGKESLLS